MIARTGKKKVGRGGTPPDRPLRERILGAALAAFREFGYAGASTLEIATRAKASKRDLYALFDGKHEMLAACIAEHAKRIRPALDLPPASDREQLAAILTNFGTATLRGVCESGVLAVYRLAIGESDRSPEIAKTLDSAGREANVAILVEFLSQAKARGLFADGDPNMMATTFYGLLWGNLLIRLLLRVAPLPALTEMEHRGREASRLLLALYPEAERRAQ